jgi:hypothetical protein
VTGRLGPLAQAFGWVLVLAALLWTAVALAWLVWYLAWPSEESTDE